MVLKRLLIGLLFPALLWVQSGYSQQLITIGVVGDGPSPDFDQVKTLFQEEILELTRGEFEVRFDEKNFQSGNWNLDGIQAAFSELQSNSEIDMVLALGFVSSLVATRSEDISKPTFAPLVLDSNLLNLPQQGNSSGVENLNYLSEEVRFSEDVTTFHSIVEFSKLALLVDSTIFESVPELAMSGIEWAQELGVDLIYVVNESSSENLVEKIPLDVEAVVVAALPRLGRDNISVLAKELIKRKIPSYSLIGTTPVKLGMLAASAPDSDWKRLARKNALNLQAVLLGENAGDQPISFRHKRQLTINMKTARELGISPKFDILSTAILLHNENENTGPIWTLSEVAAEALASNLSIRASKAGINASAENQIQAQALRKPQISTSFGATQLADDNQGVLSGVSAERTTVAAISVNQLLYSQTVNSDIDVQKLIQQSVVQGHKVVELDVIQQATVGFLDILKAQTLVDIRTRSLNLSRTNLDLAQDRVRIGSANTSDIYRWESDVATTRQSLYQAQAQFRQSMNGLNLLLSRPIAEKFQTNPATLDDESLLISNPELIEVIDNQRSFDLMRILFIEQGLKESPEIQQLEHQILSTERQLASNRQAYWSPEISLNGQVSQTIDEHPKLTSSSEGESDWQVSLNFSIPLYQGGGKKSRVSQSNYQLQQLKLQKDFVKDQVENNIRVSLHAIQASYPSINLAKLASESAQKNLDLVQNNYSEGTISIIQLLDARDAAFNAQQSATDAVYNFLIDLMNLQRSTGVFDFFLDPVTKEQTTRRIIEYVSKNK